MNRLLILLLLSATMARAQDADSQLAAERARLAAARSQAEARYKAEEKACYSKFAVNDCQAKAKVQRRRTLEDLRRQEISINDAERKRKAAARREEERNATMIERDDAAKARGMQAQDRQTRADDKAVSRASQAASAPQKAQQQQQEMQQRQRDKQLAQQRRDADAAENVQQRDKRLAEAREHREKQQKHIAERKKPPASSLPTSP